MYTGVELMLLWCFFVFIASALSPSDAQRCDWLGLILASDRAASTQASCLSLSSLCEASGQAS
jgi:hypothetical protein